MKVILVLQQEEIVVQSPLREQLLVGAHFPDPPFVQHDNLICVLDCGQTVSYHEAGTSLKEPGQGILDQLLRFRIYVSRCFVQNKHCRIEG